MLVKDNGEKPKLAVSIKQLLFAKNYNIYFQIYYIDGGKF